MPVFCALVAGSNPSGGRGKRGKRQPGGLSGKAGSAPSLLARKGERSPLQGLRATIERTVSNPSAISVSAAGIADASTRCLLRKESRAHRGRNSRLTHRARQDSRSLPASQDSSLGYHFLRSPLRLPEALIFLRFRVFLFPGNCGTFPACNLPGCSGSPRLYSADTKEPLPSISENFRFFLIGFGTFKIFPADGQGQGPLIKLSY